MKKILFLLAITFLTTSCKESTKNSDNTLAKVTSKNEKPNYKDLYVSITFSDGPLKGTHKFVKEKGLIAGIGINYTKDSKNPNQVNSTSFSCNGLISEDGKLKLMFISKSFKGKVEKGNHEAIYFTNSSKEKYCTQFMILNNGYNFDFTRMKSKNTSCNPTKLTGFSDWKEGTVMNRRAVSGNFTDTFELNFKNKDGKSVQKVTTNVEVVFNARQQEMKNKN